MRTKISEGAGGKVTITFVDLPVINPKLTRFAPIYRAKPIGPEGQISKYTVTVFLPRNDYAEPVIMVEKGSDGSDTGIIVQMPGPRSLVMGASLDAGKDCSKIFGALVFAFSELSNG